MSDLVSDNTNMSNFFLAILLATIFFESGYSLKIDLEGEEGRFSDNLHFL